ncbi:large ribosomal subunit protein uL15m [Parasteatoda tepidariorum]|uniref:Large ribosomal subunit protein uL15m n=1 Tax=Parasteatoda tepidariorum TaxID=114398 RepID=A0A2L2YAH4_PARTP|nr:39S ribosomal protein L15, mitochondrial [Parasteatoda tepidariorum]
MARSKGTETALELLRYLPRVSQYNVLHNPGEFKKKNRPRGQHGGTTHGHGNKGAKQRCSYPRLGFEGRKKPFYLKVPREFYYRGHHLRRQYPPVSLEQLQLLIDTGRVDPSQPIDLTSICNTQLYKIYPFEKHFGVHLTDEGADCFTAKVNIEVQHAKETVIAAIERNGGTIINAYYDIDSVLAKVNPQKFFERGHPIPFRKLPPEDAVEFYTDPKCRGYLADPEKIADERLALAQKYGYELPDISKDPDYDMLTIRKDPRQIFLGLEPGWLVNLAEKCILRPTDQVLQEYYKS